jgi:hypothetical protein
MSVKYLPADPYSPSGRLIPKRRAPKCTLCGVVLWKPMYPGPYQQRNKAGERLGYVPFHGVTQMTSLGTGGLPCCWNGKACKKRRKKP